MANSQPPQYFTNDLRPVTVDVPTLKSVLGELRAAIRSAIDLIQANFKAPDAKISEAYGTIAYGGLGIALMFLRLEAQAKYLADDKSSLPDFRKLGFSYLNTNKVKLDLAPGRSTLLCHPFLGAVILRILANPYEKSPPEAEPLNSYLKEDVVALDEAIRSAIYQNPTVTRHGHEMGCDEVLLGRAGILWALLNIRNSVLSQEVLNVVEGIFGRAPELMNAMIHAGKLGAKEYTKKHGEATAFPLMWPWIDDYCSLGAMHGITGILTVLSSCPTSELHCHLPIIAETITAVCKLAISHNGHLPMSLPPYPSSRPSPLVQACHGTTGLLLLLAGAKGKEELNAYYQPEWDEAARLGSQRIWEEGLLSKGGGLCHGIAGNAWPWLILALEAQPLTGPETPGGSVEQSNVAGDDSLARALAFLLHAKETQPFATSSSETGIQDRYRLPDNPYSLFEGLAGTVCAWSEACVVITARLRLMKAGHLDAESDLDSILRDLRGFPGLGGYGGAFGLL